MNSLEERIVYSSYGFGGSVRQSGYRVGESVGRLYDKDVSSILHMEFI